VFPFVSNSQTLSADRATTFSDCNDCPQMVVVPGGTFAMGSSISEVGRWDNEGPQYIVEVETIAIGVFEISHDDWETCLEDGGCNNYAPPDHSWGKGTRPVTDISFHQIQSYLSYLSEKTGKIYRLPTEAEWEYSARAGSSSAYWWGDHIGQGHAVSRNSGTHWSYWKTAKGDQLEPNPWGLHHVAGNVWEITDSCWTMDYEEDLGNDPYAPARSCTFRMIRGGSFLSEPEDLRSAARMFVELDESRKTVGFRVVRDFP